MDSYSPFIIYSNIAEYMLTRGYLCPYQTEFIECVRTNDQHRFYELLSIPDPYCYLHTLQSEDISLDIYHILASKWTRSDRSLLKDKDYNMFVYFARPTPEGKKVTKQETMIAMNYFIRTGTRAILFVHGSDLIPAANKHLSDKLICPSSDNYSIKLKHASSFDITVENHNWVPKHVILPDSDKFFKTQNLERGKIPRISREDPAIIDMDPKIGDVVMIYRTEDFSDVESLYFREVTAIPIEGYTKSKKAASKR